MRRLISLAVSLICSVLVLAPCALSQATSGAIQGRITDSSGAVIEGADVTARNENTGLKQSGTTDAAGYVLKNLPPGSYTVTATKSGFKKVQQSGVVLHIDQQLPLDFQLPPGSVSDSVTVTAEAPMLQTRSVATGEVIQSKQILDLPLEGRNFLDLARLTTGVVSGGGGNTLNLSVNGQREFANSVLVDGVESTGNRNNDTGMRPSVDAVQEFKVATSAYSAQYGRAAGGVISVQTKSGSNSFHGSIYEFYRPSATAAENYAFSGAGVPSQLSQHNFGATLGGPIIRDKTQFFISFEQTRLRDAINYVNSVPPTDQISFLPNGDIDLSGLRDPGDGNQNIPIFDPAVNYANFGGFAQQFPGSIIPAASVSPAGKAILQNFFPAPNLTVPLNLANGFGWYNNFEVNAPYAYNGKNGDARVDHEISSSDRLAIAYHYSDFNSLSGDPFWGAIPVKGGGDADIGDQEDSRDQQISATETHFFSSRALNEFRFGYSRFRLDQLSLLNGRNLADQFGLANVNLPGFPSTSGFPYISLSTGYTTGGSTFKPLFFDDNNFQVSDNITINRSKHEFLFGVDYRRLNAHPIFSLFPTGFQYYAGAYSFSSNTGDPTFNNFTGIPYDPDPLSAFSYGGSDIADLLTGGPQSVQIGLQLTTPHTQSWELHFYGEDVWKVTDRLTLTYGLRYEFQTPFTEADGHLSGYDLATNSILIGGRGGNSDSLINLRKTNFSPRLGFAFQLTPRTVLRAGYGLFYTPENDARSDVLTKNYPFAVQEYDFNSPFNGAYSYFLDTGVPRITTVPVADNVSSIAAADIPNGNVQNVYFVDPKMKTGYSQLFNATVQRELSPSLTIEAAYVGSLTHDLPYAIGNINHLSRITPLLGQIQAQRSLGWGKYNSLQVKATKRLSGNLSFLAAYTYAHNIDNGPAPFNLGRNHNQPQNPFDLNLELASSDSDIRHNFVYSSLYQLPFGHGQHFFGDWHGARQLILGGWQLNGILVARTGTPINVIRNGRGVGGISDTEGLRPDLVGDPNLPRGDRTLAHYFNTAAFDVSRFNCTTNPDPDCDPAAIGTAGRNLVRGPGFINTDFSIFKDFAFKETMKLQLRFEFFNLTNTPHFAAPGADKSSPADFGKITHSGSPRVIQFAGKFIF